MVNIPPTAFDTGVGPLIQPKAKSKGYLSVGERIVVGKGDPIVWTSAILSKKTNTYKDSSYYWSWIEEDSGTLGEGFLLQGQPWGVLRGVHSDLSVPHTQFAYNKVNGNKEEKRHSKKKVDLDEEIPF